MTREEAETRAAQLEREDPERDRYRYFAREGSDGHWEVARVELPERLRPETYAPTIEAKPRPSPADDPRTGNERRLPGLPGGL